MVFTFNRPNYLKNFVRSHQECAPEFNLLIIDDASTDPDQIKILDDFRKQDGIEVMTAYGASHRHGGLYQNMNEALAIAGRRGYQFMNLFQDDMQIVRPATDDILKACGILDMIKHGLHINLTFRKYLDVKNEPKICDVANVYRSQNLQVSDTGLIHVKRAISSGFIFQESERAHSALAVQLGFKGYVFRDPVCAFVPWPIFYRNKKKTKIAPLGTIRKTSNVKFIRTISPDEIISLKARDIKTLPYMEEWCRPANSYWLAPYNYTNSLRDWGKRIVRSAMDGKLNWRIIPHLISPSTPVQTPKLELKRHD
ncbi:glycosyltransferase [Roseobacter sp. AzwK-3b]|uniref:glycosyltransferase n=1 Tax=Roseobacter sp. AzwK-3b TaxID=351016 RepID=UPI0012F49289|nr:glycosyltransferase [Roseobacter sp. AzwK-3b]